MTLRWLGLLVVVVESTAMARMDSGWSRFFVAKWKKRAGKEMDRRVNLQVSLTFLIRIIYFIY